MKALVGVTAVTFALLCVFTGIPISRADGQVPVSSPFQDPVETPFLSGVALEDQFGEPHQWAFPGPRPMVLLAADKRGYPSLKPWIEAVRTRSPHDVIVIGVADMRGVPGLLRGKVQRKFAAAEAHPVLLDWDGTVLAGLAPAGGVPNAYLVSREGRVMLHLSGDATTAKLEKLQHELRDLLSSAVSKETPASIASSKN